MYVKRIGQEKIMCAVAMGTKVNACFHEKKKSQKKHTKTLLKTVTKKLQKQVTRAVAEKLQF